LEVKMKKRIAIVLAFASMTFSSLSSALEIDVDIGSAGFTLRAYEDTTQLFHLTTQHEGDTHLSGYMSNDTHVIGALDGIPDSLVIEQTVQYEYTNGPYYNQPHFTPVLYSDMDFSGTGAPSCIWGICENTYYDPITGAGYATESYSGQLNALYAVVAIGEGIQQVDVSDYDDPGVLANRHDPRIEADSALNVGISFTDPNLMPGDIVTVTYRHLFALGIDRVPLRFTIPEPSEIILFIFGLGILLAVSVNLKRSDPWTS
jgi:hypothetical protein